MATHTKNAAPRPHSSSNSRAIAGNCRWHSSIPGSAQLEGWAEVDSTCQSVFTAKDLLADWASWQALLESLALDDNINKQRAGLVLLTAPITQSSDPRILELSLRLIDPLKGEKDKRLTKADILAAAQGHQAAPAGGIAAYLDANADALPAIAVRETRKKLLTGKK